MCVSFALLLSFLLFIAFLEKRYDTYCYEKEDCVEATVTHVSLIKKSGRYSSNVSIEYTTPKGRQKEGYLTKLSDRGIRKGDKLLVGCDEDGDAYTCDSSNGKVWVVDVDGKTFKLIIVKYNHFRF